MRHMSPEKNQEGKPCQSGKSSNIPTIFSSPELFKRSAQQFSYKFYFGFLLFIVKWNFLIQSHSKKNKYRTFPSPNPNLLNSLSCKQKMHFLLLCNNTADYLYKDMFCTKPYRNYLQSNSIVFQVTHAY